MNTKHKKAAFIGAGQVGMSALYACANQGLFAEYGILDLFPGPRDGNVLDFEDARLNMHQTFVVKAIEYKDLKDFDYIFISAGIPQKPGQTRLEIGETNIEAMKGIAKQVKESGFKGITVIASNPVDIMTYTYLRYTGFDWRRVISTGTNLENSRLTHSIGTDLNVDPKSVNGWVLGEHGDSSFVAYSSISIAGIPFTKFKSRFTPENYEKDLEHPIRRKAYEIIDRKRATYYGIGSCVARIFRALLSDSKTVMAVGPLMNGQYGYDNVIFGTPCVIGSEGIVEILEIDLNDKEKAKLAESVKVLKSFTSKIDASLK